MRKGLYPIEVGDRSRRKQTSESLVLNPRKKQRLVGYLRVRANRRHDMAVLYMGVRGLIFDIDRGITIEDQCPHIGHNSRVNRIIKHSPFREHSHCMRGAQ